MDGSLDGWCLDGRMDGCVGRRVVGGWVYEWMSVGQLGLGGCMAGCVGKWEVVWWMHGWICL